MYICPLEVYQEHRIQAQIRPLLSNNYYLILVVLTHALISRLPHATTIYDVIKFAIHYLDKYDKLLKVVSK